MTATAIPSHPDLHLVAFEPGHVWLAGAGPGHPRHLTLEVVDALQRADVIVHDALVSAEVLALARQARMVEAGKRGHRPSARQADITAALIDFARQGFRVLRLKGGDPFVFGRGGEEMTALADAGIPFRILPGLTSAFAALAASGIPATMRGVNRAITLLTGHVVADGEQDIDWTMLARLDQPIVIYMGVSNLGPIVAALMAGGLAADTPAAVVMAASLPEERVLTTTLSALPGDAQRSGFAAPSVVIVGAIVGARRQPHGWQGG